MYTVLDEDEPLASHATDSDVTILKKDSFIMNAVNCLTENNMHSLAVFLS